MWVLTPAGSQNVGAFRLAWLIASFGLRRLLGRGSPSGPGSESFPDSERGCRTMLLTAAPIPGTSSAPRWLLTYEWAVWRELRAEVCGLSWEGAGGFKVVYGAETFSGKAHHCRIRENGITSSERLTLSD